MTFRVGIATLCAVLIGLSGPAVAQGGVQADLCERQARNASGVLGPEATVRIVITGTDDPVIILPDDGVPDSGASGAPLTISGVAIDLPQNDSGLVDVVVLNFGGLSIHLDLPALGWGGNWLTTVQRKIEFPWPRNPKISSGCSRQLQYICSHLSGAADDGDVAG